jgi:hypothetical protein
MSGVRMDPTSNPSSPPWIEKRRELNLFWWGRFLLFSAVAAFFLKFGIDEMIRAYQLKHPGEFLASFFSASFIILISGTLLAAFIWRMILRVKEKKGVKDPMEIQE